jgi:uncharacterized ion transporter superfamily protein YfcC
MKKQHAHNHPAVRAWTPELQQEKEQRQEARSRSLRKALVQRVELCIGLTFLLASFPTVAWVVENNAPFFIQLMAPFSMIGFAVAILMEDREG